MKKRYYMGKKPNGANAVFTSEVTPTKETHGHLYGAVVGPFRTKRAAILCAVTSPNPHIQHVNDAERIAKQGAQ